MCIRDRDSLTRGRLLAGSARGVRVMATAWAVFYCVLSIFIIVLMVRSHWLDLWAIVPLTLLILSIYLGIRPWFLGMYLIDETFVCRNWIRPFAIKRERVSKVEISDIYTLLTGAFIGWVPFIGRVRMIVIVYERNGRERRYMATSVYGRYRTIQAVANEMRGIAGLKPPFHDI